MTAVLLKAASIITMDGTILVLRRLRSTMPRKDSGGRHGCRMPSGCAPALPSRTRATVLMPGFIEAHSHPLLSGMVTQSPSYWIAPYTGYPHFSDAGLVEEGGRRATRGPTCHLQRTRSTLQQVEMPTNVDLDKYFPTRRAVVLDNSGHAAYFNSAVIAFNNRADGKPPADPTGARFGRNSDGTSNRIAYETAAILEAAMPTLQDAVPHPLESGARWFQYMAGFGITSTSEMTYSTNMLKATRPSQLGPIRL